MPTFLGTLFLVICVLLILVVLIQKGRGGGLSAAFGGAGSSAFGTRTGDVFTWVTIVLTATFLLLAIGTSMLYRPDPGTVTIDRIDPSPGTPIKEAVFVQVDCNPRGATLRYTLDGSDPNEKSEKYSKIEGIQVQPDQTVKLRAYNPGWNPSSVVTARYPKYKAEPSPKPAVAPTRPATGPASKPAAPASKPASGPASKPASKPAGKPASKPAGKAPAGS